MSVIGLIPTRRGVPPFPRYRARGRNHLALPMLAAWILSGLAACERPGADGGGGPETRGGGGGERVLDPSELHGAVLPEPRAKVDFTLTATDGEPYRFARNTEGKVALLFFGYTHCPDVCPVTMANLGAALDRLPPAVNDEIVVVFVSTDPERDTLARIRSWLDEFHPSMVGLRGPTETVNEIMASYGLPPAVKEQPDRAGGYTVGHAGSVLVFTQNGELRLMYSARTRQQEWVADLSRLVREGGLEPAAGSRGGT